MMNFTVSNRAYLKNVLNHFLANYNDGKIYRIFFEEINDTKTRDQLGYIFGGLFKAIKIFFANLGHDFSVKLIKEWIYDEVGVSELSYLPNGKQKEVIKTLSQMNKKEASEFINKVLFFIDESEALQDLVLPPELRYCWTLHVDLTDIENVYTDPRWWEEHEKDKQFLGYQAQQTCIRCGKKSVQVHHIQKGSGYAKKNPDWFTIPVCYECHIEHLHSDVAEGNFLKEIKPIIGNLDIQDFCRINYNRWYWHLFMNTSEQKAYTQQLAEKFNK
ncbi:MAG: hypothetical protein WCY19_05065 [Candidatus Gastranaerophilaceae bacterium]